jgi:hypothetical protein
VNQPERRRGIAVRAAKPLRHSAVLDFEFDLPPGRNINGKGQVVSINTKGIAGITRQIFHGGENIWSPG